MIKIKNSIRKSFIIVVSIICLSLFFSKDKHEIITGKVVAISEGGIEDILIELEDCSKTFYINRGLENKKFSIIDLNKMLLGKEVTIKYSSNWNIIDPLNKASKNIQQLKNDGKLVFEE